MPRRLRKASDLLKGLHTVRKTLADGTTRTYHYLRGTSTRIEGEYGSAEFLASFAAAKLKSRDRPTVSLKDLVVGFEASTDFNAALKPSSQVQYRRLLKHVVDAYGDMPIDLVEHPKARTEFLDWKDRMARANGLAEAENRLAVLARVLSWATERGKLGANVLATFRRAYSADRADMIWHPEHVEAFTAVASEEMRLSLFLALYTAQRQGDLLRLKLSAYRNGELFLRQGKTSANVGGLTCMPPVRVMLDQLRETRGPDSYILQTQGGEPWRKRHFSRTFKETCRRAGIPEDLHFHDLRGTAITMLADAGASETEIPRVSGHSLKWISGMLERYTARTPQQARNAMAKLEAALFPVNRTVNRHANLGDGSRPGVDFVDVSGAVRVEGPQYSNLGATRVNTLCLSYAIL